jgi:hypothetical protein
MIREPSGPVICEIEDKSRGCIIWGGVSTGLSVTEEELVIEDARRSGSNEGMSYKEEAVE